jgi:hypothetical protein
MSTDVTATALLLPGALVLLWNTAGALAVTLPYAGSARALRRRTLLLVTLTSTALAVAVGAALVPAPTPAPGDAALALVGLAALGGAAVSLPRLRRLASATAAFAPAPHTPASPALRAMAAHPLVGTPLHAVGAAALLALGTGSGAWRPASATVATLLAVLTVGAALAHGWRHSRLAEPALLPVRSLRVAPASLFTAGRVR